MTISIVEEQQKRHKCNWREIVEVNGKIMYQCTSCKDVSFDVFCNEDFFG